MFTVSVAGKRELAAPGPYEGEVGSLVAYVQGHTASSEMHRLLRAGVYPSQKAVAIPLWLGLPPW